jgi:3-deoxy-D-manno-octulosonic-acid transferase
MRYLYSFGFYLLLPFIMLRLWFKAKKLPAYKSRWSERLAKYNTKPLSESIWIHAVSLGEAVAATPFINKLLQRYPQIPVVVTTMTPTGSGQIQKNFGDRIYHLYIPYDYPGAVKRFLNQFKPRLAIIMETELWPNILHYLAKRKTPIILANARLTEKSVRGYKKLGSFARQMLNNINLIAAQSQLDANRFIELGADPQKMKLAGNMKFDNEISSEVLIKAAQLRQALGKERPIWIAASTHAGEEEQVLAAFKTIKQKIANALLILVPRHPERFSEVKKLIESYNFRIICRSQQTECAPEIDVVLGDTLGELLVLYGAADVAFVGGSLVSVGGHNLLEPAMLGLPIITGPKLCSIKEISEMLINASALLIANNQEELALGVTKLLLNPLLRNKIKVAELKLIEKHKGAISLILQWIEQNLPLLQ